MNMFARFDENPAMTLQDIKETKRYGRTHARTDNVKTVYPPQTKFAGGITNIFSLKLSIYCFGYLKEQSLSSSFEYLQHIEDKKDKKKSFYLQILSEEN